MDINEVMKRLTTQQQCIIINAINCDIPKDQIPEAQTEAGSAFYDELMQEKAAMPDVIFECPDFEDGPADTEELRKIMFDEPTDKVLADRSIDYIFGDYREELITIIAGKLGTSYKPKYNKSGVTFFGHKGRILKIVKRQKSLEVEFNVPVPKLPSVIVLSDKDAMEKKMGTCRWIYKGDSLSTVINLVEEAKKNY